jgi:hypothetical protein
LGCQATFELTLPVPTTISNLQQQNHQQANHDNTCLTWMDQKSKAVSCWSCNITTFAEELEKSRCKLLKVSNQYGQFDMLTLPKVVVRIHVVQGEDEVDQCPAAGDTWTRIFTHNIYEIAEKSPQQQFGGNTTMSAVITLWELLTKCQTIIFISHITTL